MHETIQKSIEKLVFIDDVIVIHPNYYLRHFKGYSVQLINDQI